MGLDFKICKKNKNSSQMLTHGGYLIKNIQWRRQIYLLGGMLHPRRSFHFFSHGARFKSMFKFGGKLECNKPAPQILASKFKLSWKLIELPEEHRPARETVKKEKN